MSAPARPAPAAPIRVAAGTTAGQAVRDAGLPARGEVDAVVVVRDADGRLRDLSWVPDTDADVEPVAANTDDGRSVIRHSTAHVLAQAVQEPHLPARCFTTQRCAMTSGIHHVTAITRDVQANVDFWMGFLGLSLVDRKSVV